MILTDPIPLAGKVVCVNLTSLDEECVDDECILHRADYAWIEEGHPTVVAFSFAQAYDIVKLEAALKCGAIKLAHPPQVPPATFAKILAIAKIARELDPELKKLL